MQINIKELVLWSCISLGIIVSLFFMGCKSLTFEDTCQNVVTDLQEYIDAVCKTNTTCQCYCLNAGQDYITMAAGDCICRDVTDDISKVVYWTADTVLSNATTTPRKVCLMWSIAVPVGTEEDIEYCIDNINYCGEAILASGYW